nr:uncharacterized protein LOC127296400 isoform X4 [Lolium perenne]XP_051182425.1 uncharacterized protein LOC127296400 isoform X5 [Lolium perenne]XP_051182426.1 uncharacterized protein LOC127296400 isoform X6 [Lolium perenne]
MRLIVLVMPLQGIVPGRCESPPRSPFLLQPRRCYPSNSSPFVLLRSNEPHHRLPGHPHGPFSGGALTSPSPASDPPRRGASTTPSASSRLSLPRQIRARLDLCHGVSVPELRLVLGQKGLASSSKQKPNVYLSDPWMGQGPAFSPAPALYPAPAAGQIRPRTAQHLLLSRIGSRSGAVRYAKSSGCSSASYNRYEDMFDEDDVSKVTLPAWPGQGYGTPLVIFRTLSPICILSVLGCIRSSV